MRQPLILMGMLWCACREAEPTDADADGFHAGQDCDDDNPAVFPGAEEICDGIDQDCDGRVDEGVGDAIAWYLDADADGFGADYLPAILACEAPDRYVDRAGDCNDADASLNPESVWYTDADGDGHGDPETRETACRVGPDRVPRGEDCDDEDPERHPDALERCNDLDDDCDGEVDEEGIDPLPWLADTDRDGFGTGEPVFLCGSHDGAWSIIPGDCDDSDASIYPGAPEFFDRRDTDCDGLDDDFFRTVGRGGGVSSAGGGVLSLAFGARLGPSGTPGIASSEPNQDVTITYGFDRTVRQRTFSGPADSAVWSMAVLDDATGDGQQDLVMGAPLELGRTGGVYLVEGPLDAAATPEEATFLQARSGDHTFVGAVVHAVDPSTSEGGLIVTSTEGGLTTSGVTGSYTVWMDAEPGSLDSLDDAETILSGPYGFGLDARSVLDLDGDGQRDLIISDGTRVLVYHEPPAAGGPSEADLSWSWATGEWLGQTLAGGDFDGDGYGDVIIGSPGRGTAGRLYIMTDLVEGQARSTAHATGISGERGLGIGTFDAGDLDKDGKDDILTTDGLGTYVWFGTTEGGTYFVDVDHRWGGNTARWPSAVRVGDLDQDGHVDLLWHHGANAYYLFTDL